MPLLAIFCLFALSSHITKFLEFLNYEVLSLQEEILSYNPLTFMCMCLIYFVLKSLKFSKVTNGKNIDTNENEFRLVAPGYGRCLEAKDFSQTSSLRIHEDFSCPPMHEVSCDALTDTPWCFILKAKSRFGIPGMECREKNELVVFSVIGPECLNKLGILSKIPCK